MKAAMSARSKVKPINEGDDMGDELLLEEDPSSVAAHAAATLERYKDQREADKARLQWQVNRLGYALFLIGTALLPVHPLLGSPVPLVAAVPLLMGGGVILMSTAGNDIDKAARKHRRWCDAFFFIAGAHGIIGALGQHPLLYVSLLRAAPSLYYFAKRQAVYMEGASVRFSDLALAFGCVFTLAFLGRILAGGMAGDSSLLIGIVSPVCVICAGINALMLMRMRRVGRADEAARRPAFWEAMLVETAMIQLLNAVKYATAIATLTEGTRSWDIAMTTSHSKSTALTETLSNAVTLVICICTLRFKATVFGAVTRLFERRQRMADGAVMAALLTMEPPSVGDTWWLQDNEAVAQGRSQHFYEGVVVQAHDDEIIVEALDPSAIPDTIEQRTTLPFARAHVDTSVLMTNAQESLRGVVFDKLNAGMMEREAGMGLYDLSYACKPGQIDWFISHAWDDDAMGKYTEMQKAALEFKTRHNRWPVLWLDKCCIDQADPASILVALKSLPLYLQACDTFFVCAGETYFTRLWCVWELYVLFALSENVDPKIQVADVVGAGAAHHKLSNFKFDDARCFDPNQQSHLRAAIASAPGGHSRFEEQVRSLAKLLPESENHPDSMILQNEPFRPHGNGRAPAGQ